MGKADLKGDVDPFGDHVSDIRFHDNFDLDLRVFVDKTPDRWHQELFCVEDGDGDAQ